MKIISRTEFLKLPENTLYLKTGGRFGNFGELEIKASGPNDGWNNDWITGNFFTYAKEPFNHEFAEFNLGDEFRWDENQNIRDGSFEGEDETYFAVLDNEDILLVLEKLTKCLK